MTASLSDGGASASSGKIVVLCGGVGGSRLLRALAGVVSHDRLTAIINTADDEWFHGLYVSPDPDIVTYTLAGEVDEERGWGLRGDTFRWLESLRRFGHQTWFNIGDRDLATHLHRTRLMREGVPMTSIVADIARAFGVDVRLLPMTNDRVRTIVETDAGDQPFQEFLVKNHARDRVRAVRFEGAAEASPGLDVLQAIREAQAIVIAPSNPIASIGPILALDDIADALAVSVAARAAVSPIIAGASLQPPAAEMMSGLGHAVDVTGVAAMYRGFIDALLIDEADAARAPLIEEMGIRPIVAPIIMRDEPFRTELARTLLDALAIKY
jgi:LPPG:FO 2-phospho-L-lactate transferase